MDQLLVPQGYTQLEPTIRACLSAAQEQGIDISTVELGRSPSSCFVITIDDKIIELTAVINDYAALNLNGIEQPNAFTLFVTYGARFQVDNQISVDSKHHGQKMDLFCVEGTRKSIPANIELNTQDEREKHLCWLLACLVLDFPVEDAVVLARAACQSRVSRETWPTSSVQFPKPILEDAELGIHLGWDNSEPVSFPRMEAKSLGLYPVVDDVTWIERLLKLGIKTVQLRIKDPNHPKLKDQIREAIRLGKVFDGQVFINDYWQLAIEYGAYGIHLGQEDLETADLKAIANAGIRLGLSTHGYYEIQRIQQLSPSYIALGHIYPTTTKVMPSKPQGLVRLKLYQALIGEFPTVAIGGIDLSRAREVWQCGVSSLAVVRAITLSEEPKDVIADFNLVMSEKRVSDERE